jgi:hypothetical protein
MFTIQWGNNWKQENGIHIFNVSDTNQTAKIKVVGDFSDFESQTFGQVFGSKILKTSWKLTKDDGTIFGSYKASGENGISFSVAKKNVGSYSVRIEIEWIYFTSSGFFKKKAIKEASFKIETEGDNGNDGNETSSGGDDSFALPFKSTITNVNTTTNLITTQEDISAQDLKLPQAIKDTITETKETTNYAIKYGAVDYKN